MNKERQRKLEARERRQASLANTFKAPEQDSKPDVKTDNQVKKVAKKKTDKPVKKVIVEQKRGRGRPPKPIKDSPEPAPFRLVKRKRKTDEDRRTV